MKKTYVIPAVKVVALAEGEQLCAASEQSFSVRSTSNTSDVFNSKGGDAFFDDEEEDY